MSRRCGTGPRRRGRRTWRRPRTGGCWGGTPSVTARPAPNARPLIVTTSTLTGCRISGGQVVSTLLPLLPRRGVAGRPDAAGPRREICEGIMSRIFYDCEFLEDGRTIDLISIGLAADDGREYYAVASDARWDRIRKHAWLVRNVVPYLPVTGRTSLDSYLANHPNSYPRPLIDFVLDHPAERRLQLSGHALLEQRQQRLGGESSQRADGLDQLVPLLVGLAGLLERLPQLAQEQLRERARDRLAVAADPLHQHERGVQPDAQRHDLLGVAHQGRARDFEAPVAQRHEQPQLAHALGVPGRDLAEALDQLLRGDRLRGLGLERRGDRDAQSEQPLGQPVRSAQQALDRGEVEPVGLQILDQAQAGDVL